MGLEKVAFETKLSENAMRVLERRYLMKDDAGRVIESPTELFYRVAENIAEIDKQYGKNEKEVKKLAQSFYNSMASLEFMPNSPTLMNAGRELQQLSACFVLPVEDSIESIFNSARDGAIVHKSGGGTGYSFSKLRPKGDVVKTTSGIASGPVSFMYAFNVYTDVVKQGGTRRGANMGMLRVDHPDIEEFINAKSEPNDSNKQLLERIKQKLGIDEEHPYFQAFKKTIVEGTQLQNFNISVALTDEFMKSLEADKEYDLINPHSKKSVGKKKAAEIFNKICQAAWQNGEPGVIFLDKINSFNPTPALGEIEATNPCGEQPLLPYESCNLGSINLSKFVKDKKVDYEGLERVVKTAVHFLDNVIDANKYPLSQVEQMTKENRKIGLGIMGFSDMLMKLRVSYNSDEALKIASEVMKFIDDKAKEVSQELATERGVFKNYKDSIYDSESKNFKGKNFKMRNATVTTIAPTGSISMIADASSGIEPLFSLAYTKTVMEGTKLTYLNSTLEEILKEEGLYSEELIKKIASEGIASTDLSSELKKIFVTASEIPAEQHVKMQAAFQKYVDNAVSKTINFPFEASVDDVKNAYLLAYKYGCKGITIYRDRSRDVQVIEKTIQKKKTAGRPKVLIGTTRRERVGSHKTIYVTKNYAPDEETEKLIELLNRKIPFETFISAGFFDADGYSAITSLGKLISKDLQRGVPLEEIAAVLEGLPGNEIGYDEGFEGERGYINQSIQDGIKKALQNFHPKNPKENNNLNDNKAGKNEEKKELCPECSSFGIVHREGCDICVNCGHSEKCS